MIFLFYRNKILYIDFFGDMMNNELIDLSGLIAHEFKSDPFFIYIFTYLRTLFESNNKIMTNIKTNIMNEKTEFLIMYTYICVYI